MMTALNHFSCCVLEITNFTLSIALMYTEWNVVTVAQSNLDGKIIVVLYTVIQILLVAISLL